MSETPRARFKVDEIVTLTLGFYRRNMIEGVSLLWDRRKSEDDHTMGRGCARVAEMLRRGVGRLTIVPSSTRAADDAGDAEGNAEGSLGIEVDEKAIVSVQR